MPTQKLRLTYDDIAATLPTLETEEQINLLWVLSSVLKKSVIKKNDSIACLSWKGLELRSGWGWMLRNISAVSVIRGTELFGKGQVTFS